MRVLKGWVYGTFIGFTILFNVRLGSVKEKINTNQPK